MPYTKFLFQDTVLFITHEETIEDQNTLLNKCLPFKGINKMVKDYNGDRVLSIEGIIEKDQNKPLLIN